MSEGAMTLLEIRREGLRALHDRLGPAGMVRFLQQYQAGRGNYTNERCEWLDDLTLDRIVETIEDQRAE